MVRVFLTGNLEQSGQAVPFRLERTGAVPQKVAGATDPETAARVAGDWHGTVPAGAQTLRIIFHLESNDVGVLNGTMDSPDQGQNGLPISSVEFDGTRLRVELTYAGVVFEGEITEDGTAIDGSWNQAGASVPLRMERQ